MELSDEYYGKVTEMRSINRVRMMYEVTHLTDIKMANGTWLNMNFLMDKSYRPKRNTYICPIQHHVSFKDFRGCFGVI